MVIHFIGTWILMVIICIIIVSNITNLGKEINKLKEINKMKEEVNKLKEKLKE